MKQCPLCLGTGYAKSPNKTVESIHELRAKGLTIRGIAKVLKLGSTTVFYHLNKSP